MISRIVSQSLARKRRRKLLSLAAITLGIAVATAVATIAVDVGDKVNHELRAVGANIEVTPAADAFPVSVGGVDLRPAGTGAYLEESSLPAMKKIFWRNSIEAFAPFVYAPARLGSHRFVLIGTWFNQTLDIGSGEFFHTGIGELHPAWKVEGRWPGSPDECVVGSAMAQALGLKTGETVEINAGELSARSRAGSAHPAQTIKLRISGILESGGIEDQEVLAPLATVQKIARLEGKVRRVEVSAITKPDDSLARTPVTRMTPDEYEKWSCSNYASTVAYQIQQAIPGSSALPVYRVSETEGNVLNRVSLLMWLLAAAALITAALAVSSMMLANVIERRAEIGLFKSLGATDARVAAIFLTEACAVGLAGGALGYGLGSELAERLGRAIFNSPVSIHWVILPGALALALLVALVGSTLPLERGLRAPAALALRSE
ncbi:MAG TPA: ABC transporter permease [Terriglobia bacterium]|nr:ABC transporter permease [Terriglobia bacterium]